MCASCLLCVRVPLRTKEGTAVDVSKRALASLPDSYGTVSTSSDKQTRGPIAPQNPSPSVTGASPLTSRRLPNFQARRLPIDAFAVPVRGCAGGHNTVLGRTPLHGKINERACAAIPKHGTQNDRIEPDDRDKHPREQSTSRKACHGHIELPSDGEEEQDCKLDADLVGRSRNREHQCIDATPSDRRPTSLRIDATWSMHFNLISAFAL